jgi:type IV pilus assembly protein PilA
MNTRKAKKGFTLVEIMIVVVIIGLLAAMAIPAFNKVRRDSRSSALVNDARQLGAAAQQYFLQTNESDVTVGYDSATGAVTGDLTEWVRIIGRGYAVEETLSIDGNFTMSHPLIRDDDGVAEVFTFNPEGQLVVEAAGGEAAAAD